VRQRLKLYPAPGTEGSLPFNGPPVTPNDPWNYFAVVNRALTDNPPGHGDAAIIARMRTINVGPGQLFDPAKLGCVGSAGSKMPSDCFRPTMVSKKL
jgi:hypothetical protein